MVRRMGWGGTRGRLGRWGDLGPGSVPLLPTPPPPLPPPPRRGPGVGRVSVFSLSPAPHARRAPSSAPPSAPGPPCPVAQAPGAPQLCHSALPTPAIPASQVQPETTPISAPPSWGSHSAPPLASVTPHPPRQCPQDPPGLRIGPLIPEQDYERLEDCDPEGSQESPLHGEEQQPLLHVPEGLRGNRVGVGLGGPGGSRVSPAWASGSGLRAWRTSQVTASSQRSLLCAQAPGTTSRTWTASSPRYPFVLGLAAVAWEAGRRAPWVGDLGGGGIILRKSPSCLRLIS